MRRVLLSTAALTALTLIGPAAALAGHGHHHHHHKAKRHAHHTRVHFVRFDAGVPGAIGHGTPSPGDVPLTTPAREDVGKVASYTGGVLTLTLNDGSSVSGAVTNRTLIKCVSPPAAVTGPRGMGHGRSDDQDEGDHSQGASQSRWGGEHGRHGGHDWDHDGRRRTEPPCDSSALVADAIVHRAVLSISPRGAEWVFIKLVR